MSEPYVNCGMTLKDGLKVTQWRRRRSDPEILRDSYMFPESAAGLSDEELQVIIDGAKEWIGRIRWSWTVVACNYLIHGEYRA